MADPQDAAPDPDIIIRKTGEVGRITLNRPKALNALSHSMVLAMTKALLDWRLDDDVKAVVVDGEGEKAFCAGGDIRMLSESGRAGDERAYMFWRDEYRLNTLIAEYPKPYLALIDGITMGGGVGISLHGPFRIAGDKTVFAMPETGIGFHPDVGAAYTLARLDGEIGAWMALTGARLKAADTLAAGLATHYVSTDRFGELLYALETEHLDADGERIESLLDGFSSDPGAADLALTQGLIDRAFAGDDPVAIAQRLAAAGDRWSTRQAETLRAKSPTSIHVALKALRRAADLDFRALMPQDLRVSARFLAEGSDFYEGVRAVILDKDNAPQWSPARLEDVDAQAVEAFFAPLAPDREQTFIEVNGGRS